MRQKRHLLSYLAGVFDSEGCACISRKCRRSGDRIGEVYYDLCVSVDMTNEIIPRLFQMTFGGNIYTHKPHNEKHKISYAWRVTGNICKPMIGALMPYIILKKPQFELGLHFLTMRKPRYYGKGLTDEEQALREVDYILNRKLNQRGVKSG